MARNIYLTENEEKAIRALTEPIVYSALKHSCEVPAIGVHLFAADLRRKTGIRDTKNPLECRAYLQRYDAAMSSLAPTAEQLTLLRYFLAGESYQGVAYQLTRARGESQIEPLVATDIPPLVDDACASVGIYTRDDLARRVQIRIYLASFHTALSPSNALSPTEEKYLRLWAEGKGHSEIADAVGERREYIKDMIKTACKRLGLCARGRGVQRSLVRAFFAQMDSPKEQIDMSDPAFN